MKKLILLLFLAPLMVMAQEEAAPANVQQEAMGVLAFGQGQIMALAEAIPADKYDWRPAEGVRSVSEAMLHVASANYFFCMMTGATLPEGIDPMTMEKSITGKENVVMAVKESFDFAMGHFKALPDDNLGDMVDFPDGNPYSKRTVMMILLAHGWEHLGQLIAYARMNEVTPPWSMPQPEGTGGEGDGGE